MFKEILLPYKNVIKYLFRFVFLYLIFSFLYSKYLNLYEGKTDFFTVNVADNVSKIYRIIGVDSHIETLNTAGLKLIINGQYVARIIEGCTAASIIILFAVFVISFGKFNYKNIAFLISGIISIYIFNILRIVFLGYILYTYPNHQDFLHRVLFPALIYGWIVILWIVFIKMNFSKKSS